LPDTSLQQLIKESPSDISREMWSLGVGLFLGFYDSMSVLTFGPSISLGVCGFD